MFGFYDIVVPADMNLNDLTPQNEGGRSKREHPIMEFLAKSADRSHSWSRAAAPCCAPTT